MGNFSNPPSSLHFLPILGDMNLVEGLPKIPSPFPSQPNKPHPKSSMFFLPYFPSYQITATHRGASVEMHSKLTIGGL